MTDAELKKAIEIAEESTCGFANDGSFEHLLATAVLELRDRLNSEREACANICDEWQYMDGERLSIKIRARGQE